MGLTKEQKDGLIHCLYGPIFDYIESIAEAPKNRVGFWGRLLGKEPENSVKLTARQLSSAALYDYEGRAKFEARVLAILDAYLKGRVEAKPLPASQPVADAVSDVEEARRTEYVRALAQIKWKELASFWFKPQEEKERLWPHYHAAELLINQAWIHGHELLQRQEEAVGMKWDDIAHSPAAHYYDNPLAECEVCTAHPEVIERMRAAGDIEPATDN